MKKFIAASFLFLGLSLFINSPKAEGTDAWVSQFNANNNRVVKYHGRAEKYCSVKNFNLSNCKEACNELAKSQRPSECKNLDNPPQAGSAAIVSSVKKSVIVDALQKKKNEWKLRRAEFLSNLKAEKDRLRLEFKEKFTAERCARVQERIQNRLSLFADAKEKHTSVYINLVNRINKFIARADALKLDTATIKSHLATLQEKIDKFKEDYAAYAAKLKETKNYTCGHSEGEFKGVLLESKTLLKQVHADAADIRTYVRETILADIRVLKAQMPDAEDEDDEAAETETND